MDYQEYLQKQLVIFNYHLHNDFGLMIKTATCIAFGAVCGWIISLFTFLIYKLAIKLGVRPIMYSENMYDDLDLDDEEEFDMIHPGYRDWNEWFFSIGTETRNT
ncbi:uncharacterized protein [Drosophila bipectinata]|uniref:uncharacterized protein n=1 Tax=Drosophila bipectinata TaxID=42026 RepID=UPI001C89772A|nr:uncharacterized protein LOC108125454 [Drosophila bipectinata]